MTSVRELLDKAQKYTTSVSEAVKAARDAYRIVTRDLAYAQERLNIKNSPYYPDTFSLAYVNNMKNSSVIQGILQSEIDKATQENEEFSKAYYKTSLFQVADDPDIYRIVPYGSGWNTRVSVIIGFEEVAGTISDWAHGIVGYRDELGVRVGSEGSNRGLKATNYWFKRVYQNDQLAQETFDNRLSYTGRPAPFWQLLNSGSLNMPSDRKDGSFNPIPSAPTDFIGHAEERIANHFRNVLLDEKERWEAETRTLEREIDNANELLNDIATLINNLKADENLDRFIIEELSTRSKSGDIKQYTDEHKLREAVKKARAGEDFNKTRIELTAKNAEGRRVRPRVQTLIRLIEGYGEL